MKVAIVSSFYASGVLDKKEIEERSLCIQHPYTWVRNLAEALAKRDVNIHVVTIGNEFNQDISFEKNNVIYDFLKPASRLTRGLTLFESDRYRINQFINKGGFSLVHGQGFNSFGFYAITSRVANIITIHQYVSPTITFPKFDDFNLCLGTIYLGFLKKFQRKILFKKMRDAIVVSDFVRKELKKDNYTGNIFTIENPISQVFFQRPPIENSSFFLYIGSLQKVKSVMDLLKAVKCRKNINLKLISQTTSGTYFNRCMNFIRKNDMMKRVELLGPFKNEKIVDVLKKCTGLVLPSISEASPMVISEAMAMSKPVIASRVGGIPFMVKHWETGFLFKVGDIKELSEKMELLFANSELCQKMGRNARQEAEKRWHPDVVAGKTIEVYEEVLDRYKFGMQTRNSNFHSNIAKA